MNKAVFVLLVVLAYGASAQNAFRVTPYVQHPAPTAMTLKFLTTENAKATVSWWPEGDMGAKKSATVTPRLAEELQYYGDKHDKPYLPEMTPWQYRYRIEGLKPDTVYGYKVELEGGASYAKSFRTAPAKNRAIRFVCYSDSETQPSSTGDCVKWDDYREMYEHSQIKGEETLPDGSKRPMTLNVWDVGIGGDGLRGCRITEKPNPHEVFRAHVDAPEKYDANGTLVAGGKHYGHLEVNVATNAEGVWTATLTPVYVFVSSNTVTHALTFERRVYPDEVVVTGRPNGIDDSVLADETGDDML